MRKRADTSKKSIRASHDGLIERIRQRRTARFGPRGRVHFAAALGIRPSTYHYYETDRVPPPALLVKMAQVTQTDLVWLLTGEGSPEVLGQATAVPGSEVVRRVAGLLEQRPGAGRAMAAFTDLLESIQAVERNRKTLRRGPSSISAAAIPGGRPRKRAAPKVDAEILPLPLQPRKRMKPNPAWKTALQPARLIPVLGRAAAASPQFWVSMIEGEGLTDQLGAAVEHLQAGQWQTAEIDPIGGRGVRGGIALVQLAKPVDLAGLSVHELVESWWISKRWPGAFALRVDGDSMQPTLEPNDLVVLSARKPAVDGEPAVVQLAGQIGVACKIYRRAGDKVRLIPANPEYPTSVHAMRDVVWALQVLARVRAGTTADRSS
jgi:hypothetical protein